MKASNLFLFGLGILVAAAVSPNAARADGETLEPVLVVSLVQRGNLMPGPNRRPSIQSVVRFKAMSGGCTRAQDFTAEVRQSASGQRSLLRIVRNRVDVCEAVARPVELELDVEGLGRGPVFVANPLLAETHFVY